MAIAGARSVDVVVQAHDRMSEKFRRMESRSERFRDAMFALKAGVAAAAAGVAYAAQRAVRSMGRMGTEIDKAAEKTGVSTETISALRHEADRLGTDMDDVEDALVTFGERMNDYTMGAANAKEMINQLGVEVTDSQGNLRGLNDMLPDLMDAFQGIENQTKKAALANQIFGDVGRKLLPLFDQGSEGLEKMKKRVKELGISWSEEGADSAREYTRAVKQLKGAGQGIAKAFATSVLPIISKGLVRTADTIKDNMGAIQGFFKGLLEGMNNLATGAVKAFTYAETAIVNFGDVAVYDFLLVKKSIISLVNDLKFHFTERLPAYLEWVSDNTLEKFKRTFIADLKIVGEYFEQWGEQLENSASTVDWISNLAPPGEEVVKRIKDRVGVEGPEAAMPDFDERKTTEQEKKLSDRIGEMSQTIGKRFSGDLQNTINERLKNLGLQTPEDVKLPEVPDADEGFDAGESIGKGVRQGMELELEESRFRTGRTAQKPPWVQTLEKPQKQTAEQMKKMREEQRKTRRALQGKSGAKPANL